MGLRLPASVSITLCFSRFLRVDTFLELVAHGKKKDVGLSFQLDLGSPATLVDRIADEVSASFETQLDPELGAQRQYPDGQPIDCIVGLKNRTVQ